MESELTVITRAKDLCSYIMTVTQKSPKQFRFTFTTRLQNLSLDVIEHLYRANEIYVTAEERTLAVQRLNQQHEALTSLRLLSYFAELAMTQQCILPKQYEQIARQSTECIRLTGAWMNSDKKRFKP